MAVKKVSEFPVVEAVGIHVFGRSPNNKNVQVLLDVKQSIGDSTTSLMSQKAITDAIGIVNNKKGTDIAIGQSIIGGTVSDPISIASPSDSIGVAIQNAVEELYKMGTGAVTGLISPQSTISIGVDAAQSTTTLDVDTLKLVDTAIGLKVINNKIGVNISDSADNILKLDSSGRIYCNGDNFWKTFN